MGLKVLQFKFDSGSLKLDSRPLKVNQKVIHTCITCQASKFTSVLRLLNRRHPEVCHKCVVKVKVKPDRTPGPNKLNKKFGMLTAVAAKNRNGAYVYKCQCECGVTIELNSSRLNVNGTLSCGCIRKKAISEQNQSRRQDLTGLKIGKLTVIKHDGMVLMKHSGYSESVWLCQCECGVTKRINGRNLKSTLKGNKGGTISCGCIIRDPDKIKSNIFKSLETSRRKYNTDYPMQNKEIQDKNTKSINNKYVRYHWENNKELICVGSYEAATIDYLNHNRIEFEWQPSPFMLSNGQTYRPDAYIKGRRIYIEVKGRMMKDAKIKIELFMQSEPLEIWGLTYLKSLGMKIKNGKLVYVPSDSTSKNN